jgi:hypothetical protein
LDGTFVSGNYSKDVITFENLKLPVGDFRFMEASQTSDDDYDGYSISYNKRPRIVGLALQFSNDLLFPFYHKTGELDENVFCQWINEEETAAELIFGGIDYSRLNSKIEWIDVDPNAAHWSAPMSDIVLKNKQGNEVTRFSFGSSDAVALFDTGASLAFMDVDDAKVLNEWHVLYINGNRLGFYRTINSGNYYKIDCDLVNQLPSLHVEWGGVLFNLTGSEYVLNFGTPSNGFCVVFIVSILTV